MATLNGIIAVELATALAEFDPDSIGSIVKAASLGYSPESLHAAIVSIAQGNVVPLPHGGGAPAPLTIQAWSFVKDKGQYHDTYGLSSAQAGELSDLLMEDRDKAFKRITDVVTTRLRMRGSERAVKIVDSGMPSKSSQSSAVASGSTSRGLKEEIRRDPATYGLYKFVATDTGRAGSERFSVQLGGGLFATHASKAGATDVARICRVKGRKYPLIADRVAFWLSGSQPCYGDAIPSKVTFDGKLAPSEAVPANPSPKAKTEAPTAGASAGHS
ncbi:MAG: putative PAS-rich protein [Phaeoacremonium minimum tetramycovirus 1]|nr:MAG: putative PAS-rich protein [Phaeoacremonium minimum tetramycovirus 1]